MTIATTSIEPQGDGMLRIVHAARTKGKSYMEIERLYGISAARAEQIMRTYFQSRAAQMDPNEERLLQLDRLNMLIEPLMDMAALGNIKSAEVLIKNLEAISELLGLRMEQQRQEITIINQFQTNVIVDVVGNVGKQLLSLVQTHVKDEREFAEIEDKWDEAISGAYEIETTRVIEKGK